MRYEPTQEYYKPIEECFSGDAELLSEFHIAAPCTLKEAVADTIAVLKANVHPDFILYKLLLGSELIGFFGTELNNTFLTTFCIKKDYRNKSVIAEFWEIINELCPNELRTALYSRNERAVSFMRRNGAEVVKSFEVNGESAVLLSL